MKHCKCKLWRREEAFLDLSVCINEFKYCPYCGKLLK